MTDLLIDCEGHPLLPRLVRMPTLSRMSEEVREIKVFEDRQRPGDWRVEAYNCDGDSGVEVTIFSGPSAERRAKRYAELLKAD